MLEVTPLLSRNAFLGSTNSTAGGGLFGGSKPALGGTGAAFGSSAGGIAVEGLFGAKTATGFGGTTSGNAFGASSNTTGGGLFGSTTNTSTGGLFGSKPATGGGGGLFGVHLQVI